MGRAPCCDKANVKRGPWSPEEDAVLKCYVEQNGTGGNWIALPQKAGLKRCGKSCRLRWLNYLRPDIKHGGFTEEEDKIICTLYRSLGSRWSVIASNLRGRTDNDVKNYWNTKLKKKYSSMQCSSAHVGGGSSRNQHNLVPSIATTTPAASTSANFRPARQDTQSCDFSLPSLPRAEQPSPYSTLAGCIPLPHPLDSIFSFASQDATLPMPTFPDPSQPAGCLVAGSNIRYVVSPPLDDISAGGSTSSLTFDNGCSITGGGQQQWGPLEDDGFFSDATFGLNPAEFLNWIGFCGGATAAGTPNFNTSGSPAGAVVEDVKPPQEVYQGVSYS